MPNAVVYADGSGIATGGPAGIGYVARVNNRDSEGSLPIRQATNQQAELLAAAYALDQIDACDNVILYSDSEYVVKGWGWLPGWIARGWRTKGKKPVANPDHWRRLQDAAARHTNVEFRWCKGHAGTPGNERADRLAAAARMQAFRELWPAAASDTTPLPR